MALRTYIPINDSSSECFLYYIVEYKSSTDIGYSTAPVAYGSPAVINGLLEGVEYSIRITKVCCDNTQGTPTTTTYTPLSGQPFQIDFVDNSTTGPAFHQMAMTVDLNSPFQRIFDQLVDLNQGQTTTNSASPVAAGTTMPLTGDIALYSSFFGAGDYDYSIALADMSNNPISGTSFPYSGTILEGDVFNVTGANFGTSANGYKLTVTLTDPT